MILLDTDHVSVLKYRDGERYRRLSARLASASDEVIGLTIITVEEQMRGWLATIARERQARRQIASYRQLHGLFEYFGEFEIISFDDLAADRFDTLGKIRIGAMDKKIAAIPVANNALLLTANRRDFEQIPGLRFENWMDEPPTPTNAG
ncbi:MAG: PIN domain-containing protein [Planctomycetaceae bacterium]|nr:PIN domain-containing protein [Planctomycetaceae bacterium]